MYALRVLIVDDEVGMRQGITRILENYKMAMPDVEDDISFELTTAANGKEAISLLSEWKPNLILLDYKLPDISGLDILEKIESNDGTTLTIMITAYASLETAVSAIKSGAFDFLSKPFTPAELRTKISKAAQSIILAKHVKRLNEEKRQVRFQFISVLGHELKAPLSAVEGYLYMLNDRTLGAELEKYDESIKRCLVRTNQMRKLIIDLLEMTKIESGNRLRELKETDLTEVAKMSVETFIPDAVKRNITINLINKEPVIFKADRTECEIILNNLVSNSVKYNKDDGKVDIEIVPGDVKDGIAGKAVIKVSDTGIGMSQEECGKLFQEFSRIKNKQTKDILGTGLGLSTLKKIAKLYGGDITVESEPEKGSTFTITLLNKDNGN